MPNPALTPLLVVKGLEIGGHIWDGTGCSLQSRLSSFVVYLMTDRGRAFIVVGFVWEMSEGCRKWFPRVPGKRKILLIEGIFSGDVKMIARETTCETYFCTHGLWNMAAITSLHILV